MNEWGFIGQGIFVGIGKCDTNNKFKSRPAAQQAWLYAILEVSAF